MKHLALTFLAAFTVCTTAHAEPVNTDFFHASGPLTIFHAFTGPDNMSHIEQITLDVKSGKYGAGLIDAGAQAVKTGFTKDGEGLPFHNANHRTLLIGIQGAMVFETGDGKKYPIRPGNLLLAEDRTGKGHSNVCEAPTGNHLCAILQVTLLDEETSLQAH